MNQHELKTNLDTCMKICLGNLVQDGFVLEEDIGKGWYSRFDLTDRMTAQGIAAGCTHDDIGRITVAYNLNRPFEELLWAVPHEAVHIAQLAKGDWDPQTGYSYWKGERFDNLPSTDSNYYINQP